MGWHQRYLPAAAVTACDLLQPCQVPASRADHGQCADQGPHHRVAEGVSQQVHLHHPVIAPCDGELPQVADGGGTFTGLAERSEIPQPRQQSCRLLCGVQAQRVPQLDHVVAQQRIRHLRGVDQAIAVAPPDRGEAGVETVGGLGHVTDGDVVGADSTQPAQQVGGGQGRVLDIDVAHLTAGVYPGIGAARDGECGGRVEAKHPAQRFLQHPLHRPQSRLGGPAVKSPAVVGQIDA